MIKKKVINVGGKTLGIRFSKQEREIHNIKKGDIVNVTTEKKSSNKKK